MYNIDGFTKSIIDTIIKLIASCNWLILMYL